VLAEIKNMSVKRTGLGRGLDALLGDVDMSPPVAPADAGVSESDPALRAISVDLLSRGMYQPRQNMRNESLEELADSIRAQGLVQPIIVRPLPGRDPSGAVRYEIVAGERRWRAAQLAGLSEIPAIVRDIPDSAAIAVALIENIQRENLNPLEESIALRRLIDEFDLTHQDAADAIGRSRTAVSNLLRLLDLGEEAKRLVMSGELEMGHGRALLGISDPGTQSAIAAEVASKGLSVRETEALVKRQTGDPRRAADNRRRANGSGRLDPDIRRLQDDLSAKLGASVTIQHAGNGNGKLVVSYNSLDELEGILAHIQ
jgi:ParB family chromosome partitioning protein